MKIRPLIPLGILILIVGVPSAIFLLNHRKSDEQTIRDFLTRNQIPYWRSAWGFERLPAANSAAQGFVYQIDRIPPDQVIQFYQSGALQQGWQSSKALPAQQLTFVRKQGDIRAFSMKIDSKAGDPSTRVVITAAASGD